MSRSSTAILNSSAVQLFPGKNAKTITKKLFANHLPAVGQFEVFAALGLLSASAPMDVPNAKKSGYQGFMQHPSCEVPILGGFFRTNGFDPCPCTFYLPKDAKGIFLSH